MREGGKGEKNRRKGRSLEEEREGRGKGKHGRGELRGCKREREGSCR